MKDWQANGLLILGLTLIWGFFAFMYYSLRTKVRARKKLDMAAKKLYFELGEMESHATEEVSIAEEAQVKKVKKASVEKAEGTEAPHSSPLKERRKSGPAEGTIWGAGKVEIGPGFEPNVPQHVGFVIGSGLKGNDPMRKLYFYRSGLSSDRELELLREVIQTIYTSPNRAATIQAMAGALSPRCPHVGVDDLAGALSEAIESMKGRKSIIEMVPLAKSLKK